ncbi:MAG: hypothetical protein DRP68_01400 [Candidatus Omnitrophota bacterium]|nr:MAG: hypothetical protein DRP68_01400 [Candidatus Omnitrophota bacterium]
MTQLRAATLSKEAIASLKRGQAITEILIQPKNKPLPMEEGVVFLYAISIGVLDELSVSQIKKFKEKFISRLREWYPDFLSKLRERKVLTDDCIEILYMALDRYFKEESKE